MTSSVYHLSQVPTALIFKELRRHTFPILASNLMGFALNFMKLYYISSLGKTALSGVVVAVTWTTSGGPNPAAHNSNHNDGKQRAAPCAPDGGEHLGLLRRRRIVYDLVDR